MTAAGHVFIHCGLVVRSEFDLHLPSAPTGSVPDVEVRWGDDIDDSTARPPGVTIAEFFDGPRRLYTATTTADGLHIVRFPECGQFEIAADLATVTVRRDRTGAHAAILPVLMAGTVATMVHGLRGATLLHASAVQIDGRALAFVGPSGQGKSTIAALLCADGAALVTDDVLLVEAEPTPTCLGGGGEVRLRRSANALAGAHAGFRSRPTADDRTAVAPLAVVTERLPLAAIVIPSPSRQADTVTVTRLAEVPSLMALLSFPRIAGWTKPDVLERQFRTLGQLAAAVPVHTATIPWGPPFDDAVAPALTAIAATG